MKIKVKMMPAGELVENFDPFLKFKQRHDDQKNRCINFRLFGLEPWYYFLLFLIKNNETLSLYISTRQFDCLQ